MILIIDNFDSFTFNIYQQLLQVTSKEVKVIRCNKIDLLGIKKLNPSHIIISPGPGRPEEAELSINIIKELKGVIPILGVCLGHQCIVKAFGGTVIRAKNIVHGKVESINCDGKGLFRNLESTINFTRYHSLAAEKKNLPSSLEITSTSIDGEIMGVRHKELNIEGVQFHPESIASEHGLSLLKNFINYRREPYNTRGNLEKIIRGENLTLEEAKGFMEELTEGSLDDITIGAYLTALNCKGVSPEEIAGCGMVLQEKRTPVVVDNSVVDTCGTGGDGLNTFNISSFSALITAASGASVAKHGNRAVSSKSGSSDFYSQLGIPIYSDPTDVANSINKNNFAFLFAPHFHRAMGFAAPARKALKIKTIMNLVGPLSNPAGADFQLIGVWDDKFCPIMARAGKLLGVKRIMVVHGLDGIDELSISDKSRIVFIDENGVEKDFIFNPKDNGIPMHKLSDLAGGNPKENSNIARDILKGKGNMAIIDMCSLNAGAALFVSGLAKTIKEGYEIAKKSVLNGTLKAKIDEIIG